MAYLCVPIKGPSIFTLLAAISVIDRIAIRNMREKYNGAMRFRYSVKSEVHPWHVI